jgi:endoglucanase
LLKLIIFYNIEFHLKKGKNVKDLILQLCSCDGVSGDEWDVANLAQKQLSKFVETFKDERFPNVLGRIGKKNSSKRILLDAHIDQIGFIVTYVKDGFLKISPCGGIDKRIFPGICVEIFGKEKIIGTVCSIPLHLSSKKYEQPLEIEEVVIDSFLSEEKAKELIPIGSYGNFFAPSIQLLENKICSKGLDNRSGVAVVIKCAELLYKSDINWEDLDCEVFFLLSTKEETGESFGAKVGTWATNPTEAISVDVSFANQPNINKKNLGELSKGPMIGISPVLNRKMSDKMIEIAKENKIPYQLEIMSNRTATNADFISVTRSGVKTSLVSIPLRYMHSPCEVIDINDLENTAKLLSLYVKSQVV